jgi:hypothetical protein
MVHGMVRYGKHTIRSSLGDNDSVGEESGDPNAIVDGTLGGTATL